MINKFIHTAGHAAHAFAHHYVAHHYGLPSHDAVEVISHTAWHYAKRGIVIVLFLL